MIIPHFDGELLISAPKSFILTGLVSEPFTLFIETSNSEYCQYLVKGDLICVSAPEGGDIRQAGILLELVKTWHVPLVALPAGHPGSARLKMIVSAGDTITLSCLIQRGTHPEQTVLCASEELAGLAMKSGNGRIEISSLPECAEISLIVADGSRVRWPMVHDFGI
jgi:hypothetical protein